MVEFDMELQILRPSRMPSVGLSSLTSTLRAGLTPTRNKRTILPQ